MGRPITNAKHLRKVKRDEGDFGLVSHQRQKTPSSMLCKSLLAQSSLAWEQCFFAVGAFFAHAGVIFYLRRIRKRVFRSGHNSRREHRP